MSKGYTEIVYILDRSGSMGGLELDTIGGFNAKSSARFVERTAFIAHTEDGFARLSCEVVVYPRTEFARKVIGKRSTVGK